MEEKKTRKPRADKGVPRGPRAEPRSMAPIHVRLVLKGDPNPVELECSRRTVEGGFHVFFYPSELDRYRETRREFAISEIRDIEITEAPGVPQPRFLPAEAELSPPVPIGDGRPRTHSARQSAMEMAQKAAQRLGEGSIKMDALPTTGTDLVTIGGLGDSVG